MWNSCSTLTVNIYFGIILYFNISVFQIELKCSLTAVAGSGTLGEQTQGWSHGLRDRKRQEEVRQSLQELLFLSKDNVTSASKKYLIREASALSAGLEPQPSCFSTFQLGVLHCVLTTQCTVSLCCCKCRLTGLESGYN